MSALPTQGKQATWRKPYQGMLRMWLYDLGSVSFLGTSLLGLVLGLALLISGKTEVVSLVFSMASVSAAASIAWQLNRLVATETSQLIPGYQANVLQQALTIALAVIGFQVSACVIFSAYEVIAQLWLAVAVGLGFVWLCLWRSHYFHLSFALFIAVPFLDELSSRLSLWASLMIVAMLFFRVISLCRQLHWNSNARVVYLNAVQMGWMWLPSIKGVAWVGKFERLFHPMNFFIGPVLTMMMLALPVIAIGLMLFSWLLDFDLPTVFLIAQFSVISCAIIHWSRIQRWRATETLFLLPCYSGLSGMKEAFFHSQYRFIVAMVLLVTCFGGLKSLFEPQLSLMFLVHLSLSTFWGCAIMLGTGSACRNSQQATAAMLVVFAHSIIVSMSFAALRDGDSVTPWLLLDIPLTLVGVLTLIWGKRQLWKYGVTVA
ncbi:ABC transporter permease [Shewanella inventionis]|uniref:ABC transporter permease n=1 Tax=Shewanella inventionis TaxID=1738770 RepID=A0ABQ1J375_9GAMM|nr:ABC transporter permease [Shewanella inventionis]MCL1157538.1 ABC transporter permease [Shewanella inventionis]GGB57619.1 ABC transporter permease [Shewanella inventionis]